jgi:DNA-directed RNA polymerase subunit beta
MSYVRRDALAIRKTFAKVKNVIPLPNLIEVQSRSFNEFAQLDFLPNERLHIGLEKVFKDVFPITYNNCMSLEYMGYELGNWECVCGKLSTIQQRYTWNCDSCHKQGISRLSKDRECTHCNKKTAEYLRCEDCLTRVAIKPTMNVAQCRSGSQTFSLPLKVKIQLVSWEEINEKKRVIRDLKEQEIFFLDLPVMVDIYEEDGIFKLGSTGTFVINGVDRVIVSQIHRSPGVVFAYGKKTKEQVATYSARLIPMRGSWIDFEIDNKDILFVRIDKNKKILVTTFLQALGIEKQDITKLFYRFNTFIINKGSCYQRFDDSCIGLRIEKGMLPKAHEVEFVNKKITKDILVLLKKLDIPGLLIAKGNLINNAFGADVYEPKTGELLFAQGSSVTEKVYNHIINVEGIEFQLIAGAGYVLNPIIPLTLSIDKCASKEEAVKEVYNKIYPGDNAPAKEMEERIQNMFFNARLYDMTRVGRVKINRKLGLNIPETTLHLTKEDIIETIRYLAGLRERGEGEVDDIDHLGNRRIRLVGELLTNQVYSGMVRIERIIKERFRLQDINKSMVPYDFINIKPLAGIVREFFTTGQLSQFMDQTNPLAEIAHKRRISSLGPGGVLKDRATYEIRDVHTSHYGRICPIETPEGQAIGLILSLATLASVNDLGFIETPYRPVVNGKVSDEVVYLDAFEESAKYIAQVEYLKNNVQFVSGEKILCRHQGNFEFVDLPKITYVDLCPNQLFSVATSLIPFLEHDDAVRALMGSNMQRQAVPLLKAESPIVGTGMERDIAKATGSCLVSKHDGVVEYVAGDKIIVRADRNQFLNLDEWCSEGIQKYYLEYFEGSSYNTCIHQKPIVKVGQRVSRGELLTNSTAVIDSEIALGTNLMVAFMAWRGYNYEDAIVLSERVVSEDLLTSIHIEEYSVDARDTRLGPEEITSDIPNVPVSALQALDEEGIIKVGSRVNPGDILVGKVTLKGDMQHSPEEKLLRAIFGEKSREVRDTSLYVPAGVEGVVIGVKVFSRSGVRKDERYKAHVAKETVKLKQELEMQKGILESMSLDACRQYLADKKVLLDGKALDNKSIDKLSFDDLIKVQCKDTAEQKEFVKIKKPFDIQMQVIDRLHQEKIAELRRGDQLSPGVLKMVKVYIASMRQMQVGDKMAGRHGNKGVVSTVVPREDMPFMEDGTPVDVVINPMSVPSRMNIGQILEIILGYYGYKVGGRFASMINQNKEVAVKQEIAKIYGKESVDKVEKQYGEHGIGQLASSIAKHGARFATPIFDSGEFDSDIKPLLESENLSLSGTYKLRDGRSGEFFDQAVTVGIMYMMKLNHMVDDKLHARSVGPYSLVTQQPLGGKAQMGGQRFGEMEVWALEAYGAAYTLQELLTYKSDDVTGRHKVYGALVRGEPIPEPGLPESFNVLIKELQGLALRVDLFKVGKEDTGE